MRFWVTLLLAVFMPLQFSWSAVGAYCQHESGREAGHFGHHSHEHKVSAADQSHDSPVKQSQSIDEDCGLCQHSALKILVQDSPVLSGREAPSVPESFRAHFSSHSPPGPERPKWFSAL
jgi:hypothetical protein